MKKQWKIAKDCKGMESGNIIDAILEERGVSDVFGFLHPTEDDLIPWESMKNIDKAAEVILDGVESGKKFFVHFDSDQDGVSAGSIAARWLKHMGADVKGTINQGKTHGVSKLDVGLLDGIDILWIVDSIETSIEPYQIITDKNIQIVITDHHLVNDELQQEMADNGNIYLVSSAIDYPNPALCGAATTWKLVSYMCWLNLDDYDEQLIDLAAAGTIADMVDISVKSPENRYICYKGFNNQVNPAIKKINGSYPFDSTSVSFGIATLTNAANRTSNNEKAMQLFMSDNNKEINALIRELKQCKEYQNAEIAELLPKLESQAETQLDNKVMYFFVDTENEIKGLLGNKLMEKYMRPIIVLSEHFDIDEDTGEVIRHQFQGSARAIGVENFKKYVECTGLGWSGGHENAFGLGVDVKDFRQFQEFMEDMLKDVEFVQETAVDIEVSEDQLTVPFIKQLESLNRISGTGFPAVNVCVKGIDQFFVNKLSGGKHLKLTTANGLDLIAWNYSGNWDQFYGDVEISVVGTAAVSFFGRQLSRQIIIQDLQVEERL